MNSILVSSKNEVLKWVRTHRTMLSFAHHLSEARKYPYIVYYIPVCSYAYRQLGMDQETEGGFSGYRKISLKRDL